MRYETKAAERWSSPVRAAMLALLITGAAIYAAAAPAFSAEMADPTKPDPSIEGAPNEASGEDLYQRGFYPEAMAEWKRAVEVNKDPGAAFRLAEEYFDAKVVERDIPAVVEYLTFGAKGGEMRAQLDLAALYDRGIGVPQDIELAALWYDAAAKQGHPSAQYNVGTMYEDGAGVEQDIARAYMYYQLAIEGGFSRLATPALERLSETMAPADIKKASLMVRSFEAQTREESAEEVAALLEARGKGE